MGGKKGATGKRGQELIKLGVRVGQHTEPWLTKIQDMGLGQVVEFMSTGGVGSQQPGVRLAREGAQDAVVQGERATDQSLTASGLMNTPYAAAIKGEQAMRGGLAVSQAERGAIMDYLNMLPGFTQMPVNSVAPMLGVPNAALAQGGNGAAGLAAAGAYGAAGNAVGQLISGYLNRPQTPAPSGGASYYTSNQPGPSYTDYVTGAPATGGGR